MSKKSIYLISFVLVLGLVSNVNGQVATNPTPADGAFHTSTWVGFLWTPGVSAVSHDVYFGENFADVNAGTGEAFRGNQAATNLIVGMPTFLYPAGLVPGTTYYWRIDEVEADSTTIHKGDVWSFSVAPETAYAPDPADGARFLNTDATVSWSAGMKAKLHHVYFGENSADVDAGTGGTYKGPVIGTVYTPGTLEFGKTYYWRVDEFDGVATHKGDLWSFSTIPIFAITDPNLVAWWKLDEGTGDMVVDWSGYAHHGKISGDVGWVEGIDGGAMEFHGGIVEMLNYEGVLGTQNRTVTAWIKTTACGDIVSWGVTTEDGQKWIVLVNGNDSNGTFEALRTECAGSRIVGSTVLTDGQWHHVASVLESGGVPTIDNIKLYVDGQREIISDSQSANLDTVSDGRKVWLGEGHHVRPFPGQVDDIRIYDKALTAEAIKQTMRGDLRLAWDPKPTNGSTPSIKGAVPLSWSSGEKASGHDVYFGTDKTAVANADTSDTSGIYRGRQNAASYSPHEGVEWGSGPYYWRIDEYNTDATVSTGSLWSFTVAGYLIVDDFESYNDLDPGDPESNRIFTVWADGYGIDTNGSIVGYDVPPFTERTIVHSGAQAMPLAYDNSGTARYSEATLTLSSQRDWTEEGVITLTLWFRGDSANTAAPMYVALNGSATVSHDNPDAALTDTWTQWNILLTDFSNQGVVLTNVNSITIGLGNRNSPQPSGSGMMYFDDIRLYR